MKSKTEADKHKDDFYEVMPNSYMDSYNLFDAEASEEEQSTEVRQRMVRQLAVLLGLLVLQFILFAVLMQSTVNLQ